VKVHRDTGKERVFKLVSLVVGKLDRPVSGSVYFDCDCCWGGCFP